MIYLYISLAAGIAVFLTLLYGLMTKKNNESALKFDKEHAIQFSNQLKLARFYHGGQTELEKLFNVAKNPWHLTPNLFQLIRFSSLIIGILLAALCFLFEPIVSVIPGMIGLIGFLYPMQVYKGRASARVGQWNAFYQFVWVLTNNASLYDARQTFLNVGKYINDNNPKYTELIQGFKDFYTYWNPQTPDPYIEKTYFDIPIAREIFQIMMSMNATGVFPKEQLAAFRIYIANEQSKYTEKVLSGVESKATMASLPFLMISAILAIAVPMIVTALSYLH